MIASRWLHSGRDSKSKLGLIAAVVGTVLVAGCGGGGATTSTSGSQTGAPQTWAQVLAAAKQEKTLLFYSPASDLTDALTAGFKKAYPWVNVESVNASAGTITSRAVTEARAGSKTADVLIVPRGDQAALEQANAVVKSEVPNDATMTKQFADTTYMSHPIYLTPTTFVYNTKKLTPAELPKTAYDLANPKWKGEIAFDEPGNGATSADFLATQRALMGNNKWMTWLNALKANDIFITTDATTAYSDVVQGQAEIALDGPNDVLGQAKGTPVAIATYADMASFVQSIWLTRGGSDPDVGKLFINWVISTAGQTAIGQTGRTPTLLTVKNTPGSLNRLVPAGTTFAPASALDGFYADPTYYQKIYTSLWPNQ